MKHLCWLFTLSLVVAADAPTAWTPELSMQVRSVASVVPSPDGRWVAYAERRAVMEAERSELVWQIWLARADGTHRFQLTRGEKGATAPEFSPDSRWVYFVSERSGKRNVWRIPVDGGEAERLTDWKGDLGGYRVSPDGKWVAFAAVEERADEEKRKKEKLDYRVVDDDPKNQNLWVVPAEASMDGKREPRRLFTAPYHVSNFDWSPDSRAIAFDHTPQPLADYWTKGDLSEVEVESGTVRVLAATGAAESNPQYSPDGRWLAYQRTIDPPRWAFDSHVVLLARQGGAVRQLPGTFDSQPNLVGWSRDSARLFYSEAKGVTRVLAAMPVDGPPATIYQPERGMTLGGALNRTGTHIGFSQEAPDTPQEAYVMALPGGKPVQVSRSNTDLPKLPLGETRRIEWKAGDGLAIEGLLTLPVGYEKGKKYPLVLIIHGGPAGVFAETFIGSPSIYPMATFTARGYAVLRANIRGSSGYGKAFRFANMADWGGKDYEDLMAGVDHVIATGVADPQKLAVMGWSYGGYMTSWVVGHTTRFKAAAVGAGVTNLWSFTGTSDILGFLPDYFGGEPWNVFENFRKHSPMSYVRNVVTPTLVLHGEADIRVPISQGYEFYNALKRRGVTAKMVVYPRMPHGPGEPKFMLDVMNRHLEWIEKYVR